MHEWWLKFKEWWFNLALRERQMVAIGASLLGIFLIYVLIWTPMLNHLNDMREQVVKDQKTLDWMRAADLQISQIESQQQDRGKTVSLITLLSLLQRKINQTGLATQLTQLKQGSNETVEMHFEKVEFDKLMQLLISVTKEQKVSVTQMSTTANTSPGIVNADVTLKLG